MRRGLRGFSSDYDRRMCPCSSIRRTSCLHLVAGFARLFRLFKKIEPHGGPLLFRTRTSSSLDTRSAAPLAAYGPGQRRLTNTRPPPPARSNCAATCTLTCGRRSAVFGTHLASGVSISRWSPLASQGELVARPPTRSRCSAWDGYYIGGRWRVNCPGCLSPDERKARHLGRRPIDRAPRPGQHSSRHSHQARQAIPRHPNKTSVRRQLRGRT